MENKIMFDVLKEIISDVSRLTREYVINPDDTRSWDKVEEDIMVEVVQKLKC